MKFGIRRWAGGSIILLALLTACATTGDATIDDGDASSGNPVDSGSSGTDGSSGGRDSSSSNQDSGGGGQDSGTGMCMQNCTMDQECQATCPPAPNGGINCCMVDMGMCYVSSGNACPLGAGDSGMD